MTFLGKAKRAIRRGIDAALNRTPMCRHDVLTSLSIASGLGDSVWVLHGLARSLRPEVCVEIGSARGKSTCFVGFALSENGSGKLYAIDPHCQTDWNDIDAVDSFDILHRNLAACGVSDFVEVLRDRSDVVAASWTRKIDILFIDGDHSYEGVKRDWELFVPFVKPYGLVIFHDTIWDLRPNETGDRPEIGVPRFVDDLRKAGYPVLTMEKDFGVSIVQPTIGGQPLSR